MPQRALSNSSSVNQSAPFFDAGRIPSSLTSVASKLALNPVQQSVSVGAQPINTFDPRSQVASTQSSVGFATSALIRAGLLPHSSVDMTSAPGMPSASENLQRIMGHAPTSNGGGIPMSQIGPLTPAQLKDMTPAQANAALQNPTGNVPTVYLATYSSVPVYEITVRGIAVMRRRGDGWLNATQILKIAGIEKTRRTKILEKSILTGEHEKIQGGYGKFQGTWIPLQRAQQVAAEYNVSHLLKPILEFDPSTADQIPKLYQRRKPASTRTSSASAMADGRSATPSGKLYSPAPLSASGPSQQPRFLSLRPPKDGQQGDMSPALFMPPGAGGLLSNYPVDMYSPSPHAIPPGSSQSEQEALKNYNVYGYAPQGVPLPELSNESYEAGDKRAADPDQDGAAAKRPRMTSPERDTSSLLGPPPVKDLNALGPAGGILRAASAPRGNRMAVGPPETAGRDGTVPRYADRALPPKPYDEGEKRMRDHLVGLFAEDGFPASTDGPTQAQASGGGIGAADGSSADAKLDKLLGDLREKASLGGLGTSGSDGPKATLDLVTDDHGHTALHWASALCRLPLVQALVARPSWQDGANVHAGNHAGETALHRSVLVTNSYDSSSFPILLESLSASLNTRDFKKRTVLHHIALVAALKGRAASARYYLACVLEHIGNEKSSKYKGLVDAQDEDGETALGIVARLGNASMVRMLLEVGARKDLPNALGIRPSDWGIEAGGEPRAQETGAAKTAVELASQNPQDIMAALARPPQVPVMKSSDVRDQLASTLQDLQATFEKELQEKQDAISTVQSHLQAATRDLAARRRNVAAAQSKLAEKDEARQRVRNLRRGLIEELTSLHGGAMDDAEIDGQIQRLEREARDAGVILSSSASTAGAEAMEEDEEDLKPTKQSLVDSINEVPFVTSHSINQDLTSWAVSTDANARDIEQLVRFRWLLSYYESSLAELSAKISEMDENSAKKETQCQQVVAICANIPQSKVEAMLDDLLTAMESDGPDVDLARVANFMQKVSRVAGPDTDIDTAPAS